MVPSKEVHIGSTSARRLTPESNFLGITTECGNILMHPLDSFSLILEGEICVSVQTSSIGISEDVDAVVCRHDDMTLGTMDPIRGKLSGNIDSASHIAAACEVVDNREFGVCSSVRRCPDCHRQAILS